MATLEQLSDVPPSHEKLNVVFVHGLGGDPRTTWMSNPSDPTTLWPAWVAADSGCPVWLLGYDAAISGWTNGALPLPKQGTTLLDLVVNEPKLKGTPLVMVGHSLGGLVVKTAMANAATLGVERYLSFLEQVKGVVFVATPHFGSDLASVVEVFKLVLRTNAQVGNLRANDGYLANLNTQFRAQHRTLDLSVRVYAEGRGVSTKGKWGFGRSPSIRVVSDMSSDPSVSGETAISLPEDHFSISKPTSRSAQIHKSLIGFLKDLRSKLERDGNLPAPEEVGGSEEPEAVATTAAFDSASPPSLGHSPATSTDLDHLVEQFQAPDPIAGPLALRKLIDLGDVGEAAIFKSAISYPATVQVRRRWLAYVRAREQSVSARLVHRVRDPASFGDAHIAASLFAGVSSLTVAIEKELYDAIKSGSGNATSECLSAWGFAGGDPTVAWRFAKEDWERLAVAGFRAACASVARSNPTSLWALEQFITYAGSDYGERQEIPNDPKTRLTNESVGSEELSGEASFTFRMWRRGELADAIIQKWSGHEHWRVRDIGAQILRYLAFSRVGTPVAEWLRREANASTREHLIAALAKTGSQPAVDQCLDHFRDTGEGSAAVAEFGWRSGRPEIAIEVLTQLTVESAWVAAPALVSLARLGQRASNLATKLEDGNSYSRSASALAVSYLDDKAWVPTLRNMQRETADVLEGLCLSAALARLSKTPEDAMELHRRLVVAGTTPYGPTGMLDFFRLHDYLQRAILDALENSRATDPGVAAAWRAETEPLA